MALVEILREGIYPSCPGLEVLVDWIKNKFKDLGATQHSCDTAVVI